MKKYRAKLPFNIENDKVSFDKDYAGENFRIVSCLQNPQDKYSELLVLTAQKAKDVVLVDGKSAQSENDYVITDDKGTVASGKYIKSSDGWKSR